MFTCFEGSAIHPNGPSIATKRMMTRAREIPVKSEPPKPAPEAIDENIEAIKRWEHAALHDRSPAERLSDWITRAAAHGGVLLAHATWFTLWIAINVGIVPGIEPFDPYPFSLLTMIVSLEAIFLALFVLASQNRITTQADKRAHLDLQIDLLAEREMTTVLRLLQDIARHLDVTLSVTPQQIRDLVKKTDLHALTDKMEELRAEQDRPSHERRGRSG